MTGPDRSRRNLTSYLSRHGWVEQPPGVAGSLWELGGPGSERLAPVGLPTYLEPDSLEWQGVIERVARHMELQVADVDRRVRREFFDVTNLRAANDVLIAGSIPLDSGVNLLTAARAMLRASATTAQGARAHISGGYSKRGDQVLGDARMGHTIDGSYVIPVLMPIPETETESDDTPFEGMTADRIAPEPAERRTMRTFAEALTAVQRRIVEPAREPTQADIAPLIAAGVSRELVAGLHSIVIDRSVTTFDASFEWAGSLTAPSRLPTNVQFPREAAELLDATARRLKTTRQEPIQSITGPIIEVFHKPGDPTGWVGVQTIRRSREVRVRVMLGAEDIDRGLEWMRASRTVVVDGKPTGGRGRPLEIRQPDRFLPLDETFLP